MTGDKILLRRSCPVRLAKESRWTTFGVARKACVIVLRVYQNG